jgi:hypothetical protein
MSVHRATRNVSSQSQRIYREKTGKDRDTLLTVMPSLACSSNTLFYLFSSDSHMEIVPLTAGIVVELLVIRGCYRRNGMSGRGG